MRTRQWTERKRDTETTTVLHSEGHGLVGTKNSCQRDYVAASSIKHCCQRNTVPAVSIKHTNTVVKEDRVAASLYNKNKQLCFLPPCFCCCSPFHFSLFIRCVSLLALPSIFIVSSPNVSFNNPGSLRVWFFILIFLKHFHFLNYSA